MSDTSKVTAIMVTELDFDNAIMENMVKQITSQVFDGHPDAALMYTMGGMTFAKEVKNILFGRKQSHDQ